MSQAWCITNENLPLFLHEKSEKFLSTLQLSPLLLGSKDLRIIQSFLNTGKDKCLYLVRAARYEMIVLFNHQTYTPSTVTFDLADRDTVDRAAQEILRCYGQVDVLINNAGISYRGNILNTHVSVQRDVMETNYFGPIALTQG